MEEFKEVMNSRANRKVYDVARAWRWGPFSITVADTNVDKSYSFNMQAGACGLQIGFFVSKLGRL